MRGDEIFFDILDNESGFWFPELMDISTTLYINATMAFKALLNESHESMVHGHGTEQGVFFPHCGVRIGTLTAETGARVILRPLVFPDSHDECLEMKEL